MISDCSGEAEVEHGRVTRPAGLAIRPLRYCYVRRSSDTTATRKAFSYCFIPTISGGNTSDYIRTLIFFVLIVFGDDY